MDLRSIFGLALLGLATPAWAGAPGATPGLVEVRPDLRDCPTPWCGGWWFRLANRKRTTCIDGERRRWCYAAQADWTELGLPDEEIAAVQAAASAEDAVLTATLVPVVLLDETFGELVVERAFIDAAR